MPRLSDPADNGHRAAPRPLAWLVLIRKHPCRPKAVQCHVLTCLALRLDWETSTGHASVAELMDDAGASERTVLAALSWARHAGLLVQVRRGHRLGSGQRLASVWLLSTCTQVHLEAPASTCSQVHLEASQPAPRAGLSRPRSKDSRPKTSLSSRELRQLALAAGADGREIDMIINEMKGNTRLDDWRAVLRAELTKDHGERFADRLAKLRDEPGSDASYDGWRSRYSGTTPPPPPQLPPEVTAALTVTSRWGRQVSAGEVPREPVPPDVDAAREVITEYRVRRSREADRAEPEHIPDAWR